MVEMYTNEKRKERKGPIVVGGACCNMRHVSKGQVNHDFLLSVTMFMGMHEYRFKFILNIITLYHPEQLVG